MFDIVIRASRPLAAAESSVSDDFPVLVPTSFEQFYRANAANVARLAFAYCRDRHLADELAQEAFIAAYRNWSDVSCYDRPDLWVRRVVLRRCANEARRRSRESCALARLGSRPPNHEGLELADRRVWDAVAQLPQRQAQVVILAYVDDRSHRDIAAVLGCSAKTVSVHLHRARRALRRRLAGEFDHDEHHREQEDEREH